jgi:hypothetical protein
MRTHRIITLSTFAVTATAIAACGGGSSVPPPVFGAPVVLVPGTTAQYTGTDAVAYTYASPAPGQANYAESYTFAETSALSAAASGSPGAFDLHNVTTYTTVQAPTTGTQKGTVTTDTFQNQTSSGVTTTVSTVAAKTVAVGTDVAAGVAGGGPYTTTTTTSTTDTTPLTTGTYPLVAGAVYQEPFAKTVSTTTSDANAGGQAPATSFVTAATQTVANDSSYTRTDTLSNGESLTFTESSNGAAQLSETGPLFTLAETIGVPVLGAAYTIPVTQTRQNATLGATPAPSATPGAFSAADWYPGAGLPPEPLSSETITVKGATTSLPAGCAGAIVEPNLYELDLASTSLNVAGSLVTEKQQRFDSNGTTVCVLRTTTTQNYAVTTGLPTVSSTETYAQILTSLTRGAGTTSALKRAVAP